MLEMDSGANTSGRRGRSVIENSKCDMVTILKIFTNAVIASYEIYQGYIITPWTVFWVTITLQSKATDTSKTFIVPKVFIFENSDWFCLKAHYLPFIHAKFHSSGSSGLAST